VSQPSDVENALWELVRLKKYGSPALFSKILAVSGTGFEFSGGDAYVAFVIERLGGLHPRWSYFGCFVHIWVYFILMRVF
jgi:hypothetical protein